MQVLKIPGGAEARWSARRQSLVTISHRLPVWEGNLLEYTYIPLKLKLPRQVFSAMANGGSLEVASQISDALIQEARWPLPGRTVSIPVPLSNPAPLNGRVILPGWAFRRLKRALQAPPGELGSFREYLPFLIVTWFFTDYVPAVVAASPKRHGIFVYRLTRYLPAALLGAHSIVSASHREPRLKMRIEEIVGVAYLRECCRLEWNTHQATVVWLVDRAFRGAWEAAGHPGLIYTCSTQVDDQVRLDMHPAPLPRFRNPANVLHEYLHGHPRQRLTTVLRQQRQADSVVWTLIFKDWQRLYLGEPGAAAKEFLLT